MYSKRESPPRDQPMGARSRSLLPGFLGIFFIVFFLSLPFFPCQILAKTTQTGGYAVTVETVPRVLPMDTAKVMVTVRDKESGSPISGAAVRIKTDMPGMPMGRGFHLTTPAPGIPGMYEGEENFAMGGVWQVVVEVAGPRGKEVASFTIKTGEDTGDQVGEKRKLDLRKYLGILLLPLLIILVIAVLVAFVQQLRLAPSRLLIPILILVAIVGITYAVTRLLKKPAPEMEMKMDMSAPDMGLDMKSLGAPLPVALERVAERPMESRVTYTGTVVPYNDEVVYPRVTGKLLSLRVYPGDRVKEGEILGRLEDGEYQARLKEASFLAKAEEEGVRKEQASRTQAKAILGKARAEFGYWKSEYAREERLFQEGAISQEELDRAKSQYLEARSMVKEASGKVKESEAAFEMEALKREAALANQEAQSFVVGYTSLLASNHGIVTERMVSPGVLVSPGMGILRIADISRVRLQAKVAQKDLGKIRVGTRIHATVSGRQDSRQQGTGGDGHSGGVIEGNVTSIFSSLDPVTRTSLVEAVLPNPWMEILPGQYLIMDFILQRKDHALTVPLSAVVPYSGKDTVWVRKNGAAERRIIKRGIEDGRRVEVLSGLEEGEEVITAGYQGLQEGGKVTPGQWGEGNLQEIILPMELPGEEEGRGSHEGHR